MIAVYSEVTEPWQNVLYTANIARICLWNDKIARWMLTWLSMNGTLHFISN